MKSSDHPIQIISQKRDGHELTDHQIRSMITGFVDGSIPEYQMTALAMAIYFQGMSLKETASLTVAMLESGDRLQWPAETKITSKHSTGGVGDKVSLILVPLLAACGLKTPKLSGRGLGITGGTLDKLESIPGLQTSLSSSQITDAIESVGCCICSATDDIAPADKKLYALRDATGTVPSIPLITSSILSKKLAEQPDCLLLDVKCGKGAFMKTTEHATELAHTLLQTGNRLGVPTECVISDMSQPLGRAVGNSVEIHEAIDALQGKGDTRLIELVLHMATHLISKQHPERFKTEIQAHIQHAIQSGEAFTKFEEMIRFQGGDLAALSTPEKTVKLCAPRDGYIKAIDPEKIGLAIIEMGGGRKTKEQTVDHAVGCTFLKQVGDKVSHGEEWVEVAYPESEAQKVKAIEYISQSITITPEIFTPPPVITQTLS